MQKSRSPPILIPYLVANPRRLPGRSRSCRLGLIGVNQKDDTEVADDMKPAHELYNRSLIEVLLILSESKHEILLWSCKCQ